MTWTRSTHSANKGDSGLIQVGFAFRPYMETLMKIRTSCGCFTVGSLGTSTSDSFCLRSSFKDCGKLPCTRIWHQKDDKGNQSSQNLRYYCVSDLRSSKRPNNSARIWSSYTSLPIKTGRMKPSITPILIQKRTKSRWISIVVRVSKSSTYLNPPYPRPKLVSIQLRISVGFLIIDKFR